MVLNTPHKIIRTDRVSHVHSAQTPEKETFWASLSDSVNAESVLVQVLV